MNQESKLNASDAFLGIPLITRKLMNSDLIPQITVSASIDFVMADVDR